jgi:hypothetical protein
MGAWFPANAPRHGGPASRHRIRCARKRAAARVHPPAADRVALDAAGATRRNSRIDGGAHGWRAYRRRRRKPSQRKAASLSPRHGCQRFPRGRHRSDTRRDLRRHRRCRVDTGVVSAISERGDSGGREGRQAAPGQDEGEVHRHHRRTGRRLLLDRHQRELDAGQRGRAASPGREVHAVARRRQDQGGVRDHRRPIGASARVHSQAR